MIHLAAFTAAISTVVPISTPNPQQAENVFEWTFGAVAANVEVINGVLDAYVGVGFANADAVNTVEIQTSNNSILLEPFVWPQNGTTIWYSPEGQTVDPDESLIVVVRLDDGGLVMSPDLN